MATGNLQRIRDFVNRDFQFIGKLFGRRATFVFLLELRESLADFVQLEPTWFKETHNTRLLCQSLQNGLTASTMYCATDELETTCFIELSAALISHAPSLIKSGKLKPWFWYCLATDTTERRLARVNFSSATRSPLRMRARRLYLFFDCNEVFATDFLQILVREALSLLVILLVIFNCLILIIQIWVAKVTTNYLLQTNLPELFYLIYILLIQQKGCRQVFADTLFFVFLCYYYNLLTYLPAFVTLELNPQRSLHACPTGTYR